MNVSEEAVEAVLSFLVAASRCGVFEAQIAREEPRLSGQFGRSGSENRPIGVLTCQATGFEFPEFLSFA